ncbi:Bacteriophage P2-related tail formation protein [Laribacter hongkongensis HLHK9]|uniref:Bacteriophage P2-related tail formation protein n=1 Tax=Laribacter hongkongensis (strain HLHK9) TaxID=557598 RepID=C1DCG0_LARHH|nr:phage tail protein I [Laribacter hongkongensis]ACO75579.1 Bacteriophage P2-related tail formation protein [Laribacter hongkongensis HLHK9]
MPDSLLPPNASRLEHAVAGTLTAATELPVPLRDLWNPDRCPEPLLPYLAWAWSVDRWDSRWPVATRRKVVADAFAVHRSKGTIDAVRRVVEPFGYLIEVVEWWQEQPPGRRGTFRIKIGVQDAGISEATFRELERLIDDARPVSRHLTGLAVSLACHGDIHVAASGFGGDVTTVYPYMPDAVTTIGQPGAGAGLHLIDTLTLSLQEST